jgi:hypothetical protein
MMAEIETYTENENKYYIYTRTHLNGNCYDFHKKESIVYGMKENNYASLIKDIILTMKLIILNMKK